MHGAAHRRRLIGYKVGLTSKAMQRSSQIDEPDYGYRLDDQLIADGAKVPHANYCRRHGASRIQPNAGSRCL